MNFEQLISLVQERRSLWDIRDSEYHNRDTLRRLWCEVATVLKTTSAIVKGKWQRLKDSHRRELKKSNQPTGSRAKGESTWKFFKQMSFLKDSYASRPMVGNIPNTAETPEDPESADVEDANEDTDKEDDSGPPPQKRARSTKNVRSEMLQIEQAKLEHLEQLRKDKQKNEDDHYYFLMSLLPYMRQIPPHRVLQTRMRLQQVLFEETINADDYPSS